MNNGKRSWTRPGSQELRYKESDYEIGLSFARCPVRTGAYEEKKKAMHSIVIDYKTETRMA